VAIALLGGVSIFGGRGTILGVVLAASVLACFLEALTLINVSAQVQNIVTGLLLLLSVVVPNLGDSIRRLRAWLARRRGGPATALPSSGDVPHLPAAANALAGKGGGIADPGD
jgi:hypothetical protein